MECPVCFTIYNTSVAVAIKLSCFHTICKPCAGQLMKKNTLSCPICFKKTENIKDLDICKTIEQIILAQRNPIARGKSDLKVNFVVRNLKGHTLEFTVKTEEKILTIKQMIETAENLPVRAQWLLHKGKALIDSETVAQAGIENADMIYLVVRSFGG